MNMNKTAVVVVSLLAGLAATAGVQAADTKPCLVAPGPPLIDSTQGHSGGPVIADPGPCKVASNAKKSKNSKGSGNGKGPGNSQGNRNGNSQGNGNGNGQGNGNGNGQGNGNGNGQGNGNDQGDGSDESKIKQGLAISPVPLDLKGRNRALVGLGSYIVNAQGGCNDCHTYPSYAKGGDPYLGEPKMVNATNYLAGGRPFGPTLKSPNLTPDPANPLTVEQQYADFVKTLRTGIDPSTGKYLQVMPWPVYQDMTDRDLRAVFEYLQAIPPAKPAAAP
jgi:hypothetical protein